MRILELLGRALRPIRSDETKLTEAMPAFTSRPAIISVSSSVFEPGASIPAEYSADGAGLFPTISWTGVPHNCASLLLIIEDPDAPKPTPFVHGIFFNIPPSEIDLPTSAVTSDGLSGEFSSRGVKMGTNSMSKPAYMPPTPPPGHGPHRYHFQLIALDTTLSFADPPSLSEIKSAIEDHILAYGELVGIYER